MNARQTGRLLLYAFIISLLILCSAPDLLAGCLDGLDLSDIGSQVSAWTHLTLLVSLLTAFALLHLLTLQTAGRQALARSLCAIWRSFPLRTRLAILAQAENHSVYAIGFIRR